MCFAVSIVYSRKYIFLQIAVSGTGGQQGRTEEGDSRRKEEEVPIGLEGCAVAGHVTVKPESWWYDRLEHEDWMVRRDMVQHFCSLVDPGIIRNWLLSSMIVYERMGD